MKPAWDKLTEEYKDSAVYLIADVDCTADGKALCTTQKVQGFPTIKYGDPQSLSNYKGGRSYEALKKFAEESLGSVCSLDKLDRCDDETKGLIAQYEATSVAELQTLAKDREEHINREVERIEEELDKFQEDMKTKIDRLGALAKKAQDEIEALEANKDNLGKFSDASHFKKLAQDQEDYEKFYNEGADQIKARKAKKQEDVFELESDKQLYFMKAVLQKREGANEEL